MQVGVHHHMRFQDVFVHIPSSIYYVQVLRLSSNLYHKTTKGNCCWPKKKMCKVSPFRGQELSFVAMVDGAT